MKTSALLIAAVILMLLLPASIVAIDQFRLTDQTDYFTLASGANATTKTLTQDLYNDETRNVSSITSNVTTDAPAASSYTAATNALYITGLDSTKSHYLTVVYSIDRLDDYFGASTGAKVIPVLMVLGIMATVGGAVYNSFSRHNE